MNKIGIYYESSEATGGVNRVASMLAVALSDNGYEVHIISRYRGNQGLFTTDNRIKYHELFKKFHSKYITFAIEFVKLRETVKREKLDILISAGAVFFGISHLCSVKHIMWDHVSFWHGNKLQSYFRSFAARNADVVVTLTKDNKEAFAAIKGCRAKIMTINNPSNIIANSITTQRDKTVISLGFLAKQKGYDLMLESWMLLPNDLKSDWTLKIAGEDEGDLPMLKKIIKKNKLESVELLGFRNDIDMLLSQSSIYAMSSRWEGMPMVLLEAQTYGLPIVSFNCKTGPSEILTDKSGILVEAENCQQLANGLEKLMRDDYLRDIMAKAAVENVSRFSIDNIVLQWVHLFKELSK